MALAPFTPYDRGMPMVRKLNRLLQEVEAGGSGAAAWDDITGKPSTFAPSSHSHAQSDITGLEAALAALIGGGASGVTTVNFGAFPGASDASVTITGQDGIEAGSTVNAWLIAKATADHSADEHWVESIAVVAGNIDPDVGFTIYAKNTGTLNEPVAERWAVTRLAGPGTGIKQIRPDNGGGHGTRLYGEYSVAWQWV